MKAHRIMLTALALTSLTACMSNGSLQSDTTESLKNYQWILNSASINGQRINGFFVQLDKPLTLSFHDNSVNIENTCNDIGGQYNLDKGELLIGQLHTTMVACADPVVAQLDKLVTDYIQGAHEMTVVTGVQPLLTLKNDKAVLVLRGQATPESLYGKGETLFFAVAPQTVPCTIGTMQHDCLQVREVHYNEQGVKIREDADWTVLHTPIEGYEHHDGVADVIRVQRYQRNNPPADAGSVVYVYDTTVESTLP
ncbi:META and DUF4377 domain-containing protein [Cardiobacteriaceae bacterium TAE3-ERU3]|nr:META and DUF4377 domain-containing protein [Cardiobacteriaceae bacterium TAE3-ERU3]